MKKKKLINILLISSCFYTKNQELLMPLIFYKYCNPANLQRFANIETQDAYARREFIAQLQTIGVTNQNTPITGNGDEDTVPFFAANFSKALEHDPVTGLLTETGQVAYRQLLVALNNGQDDSYNAIALAPGATEKLNSPEDSDSFNLAALDTSLYSIPKFPEISTPEAAAQLIEVYLQAICRNVDYSDYGTGKNSDNNGAGGSITNTAASILNSLGVAFHGPKPVTSHNLFRISSNGILTGAYISQFLFLPLKALFPGVSGANNLSQSVLTVMDQLYPIASNREFGVSFSDFVTLQNGIVPKQYVQEDFSEQRRYIIDGRDMASYVHTSSPYQAFYNAAYILFSYGAPLSSALPYYNGSLKTAAPFVNMGIVDAFGVLALATWEAAKVTWAVKWRANRTFRPEAFAGLVDRAIVTGTNPFNLDQSLFNQELQNLVLAYNQTQATIPYSGYTLEQCSTNLLSQCYPESCPIHPSHPSAHAVLSGATATILKAYFNDEAKISSFTTPVIPDPNNPAILIPLEDGSENIITIGGELNKLAYNIAIGRNFAGIHYRADAENGLILGEQIAINVLQSTGIMFVEQSFNGFELTKIDGQRIRILPNQIINID